MASHFRAIGYFETMTLNSDPIMGHTCFTSTTESQMSIYVAQCPPFSRYRISVSNFCEECDREDAEEVSGKKKES